MKTLSSPQEIQSWRKETQGSSIGFVPTMGALHAGHISLIQKSKQQNEITVVSIFLNPTQFNSSKDFDSYPQTFEQDLEVLESQEIDILFLPESQDMYPDSYLFQIVENSLSQKFCGAHRPGHFQGMLTVVMKLFQLVRPNQAYFGEKDFQQLQLIKNMVEAFFLPINVIAVPTVREQDGLAMSSRNQKLNEDQRFLAQQFYQTLKELDSPLQTVKRLQDLGFEVDYVDDYNSRRLAAAIIGDVRLIDNVPN